MSFSISREDYRIEIRNFDVTQPTIYITVGTECVILHSYHALRSFVKDLNVALKIVEGDETP